jgi:membrane-associated phospholipid phosphatase
MAFKATAAAIFLGTTLFTIPVNAASLNPSPSPVAALEQAPAQGGAAQASSEGPKAWQAAPADLDLNLKPSQAEQAENGDMDRFNGKYVKGILVDSGKLFTSPLRWDSSDWLKFGVVLGGTATLFLADEPLNDFTRKNQNSAGKGIASVGNTIGNPLLHFPSLGAFYLYGHMADDSKARRTSLLAFESLTITGLVTSAHKMLFNRHRPKAGDGNWAWDGPSISGENVSFCSGHTSSSFALATVFAEEYKDNKYVPPVAYGLATMVAMSRMYSNEHWVSDTFFGAALGYFTSKAILSYHKKNEKSALSKRLSLVPEVSSRMTGMTVNYQF